MNYNIIITLALILFTIIQSASAQSHNLPDKLECRVFAEGKREVGTLFLASHTHRKEIAYFFHYVSTYGGIIANESVAVRKDDRGVFNFSYGKFGADWTFTPIRGLQYKGVQRINGKISGVYAECRAL